MTRLTREGITLRNWWDSDATALPTIAIERIYAEPYAYNAASRRVLEKNGFTCEAVLKKYVIKNNILQNSCIYSRLRTH